MTPDKTKEALNALAKFAKDHGAYTPERLNEYGRSLPSTYLSPGNKLAHVAFTAQEACKLVDEGRIEKAMRHLGWAAGALWVWVFLL